MRLFIATVALWALASAKPEMYKEKEDFQFSRSSSDDGAKSGYYGAQRGNMGGNYERAHNMDSLAQHQMSTLVRQVDGELGQGANTRTGSVFTAGNSRGIYGSGNYDLSNLKGRNFDESGSYDDLYSSSLLSQNSRNHASLYSGMNNAQYSGSQLDSSSLSSGYQSGRLASQYAQDQDNQQAESQYHGSSSNYQYGGQGVSQFKYYSQGSSQAKNDYGHSADLQNNNNYNVNTKNRLISTTPHRIYIRPGTRVVVPIAAQTYDASHSSLSQQQSAVKSDAEILNSDRNYVIKPVTAPKHYESSYSYRKEWEKHDTKPIAIIPTENPFPKNSELYEDTHISGASGQQYLSEVDSKNILNTYLSNAQLNSLDSGHLNSLNTAHSSSLNSASSSGYSGNTKSKASNRLQYLSQTQNAAELASSSDVHQANMQNLGVSNLYNNLNLVDGNSRPKSYQSSYSYHKSWERRGDPYVIKPAESDISSQISQKIVADTASYGTHSQSQFGSHYSQSQDDCVEPIRHKRSYNTHKFQQEEKDQQFELLRPEQDTNNRWDFSSQFSQSSQNLEQLGQQTQNSWGELESFGQNQNQMDQLEDLGQHTQNSWGYLESFGPQKNKIGKLEDLGQHAQSVWDHSDDLDHQSQNPVGRLEDLGQQTQNSWGELESFDQHQNQMGQLEDIGQQTQNSWGNLESFGLQKNKIEKLEDLGQQTQSVWDHSDNLDHQSQNPFGRVEDLTQQTQNTWAHIGNLDQETQNHIGKLEGLGQISQNTWEHSDNLSQNFLTEAGNLREFGQQAQNKEDDIENLDKLSQIQIGKLNVGQQTQGMWDHIDTFNNQDQNQVGKLDDLGQQTQNSWGVENFNQQSLSQTEQLGNFGQETQNFWDEIENSHRDHSQAGRKEIIEQQRQTSEIGQESQKTWNNMENQKTQFEIERLAPQSPSKFHTSNKINGQVYNNQWSNIEKVDQQTQNGWNQVDNVSSPVVPEATRNLGKTSQDNIENGTPSTTFQDYMNFWSDIYKESNFWHKQENNEHTFEQHSFDSSHHSSQSSNRESGNNDETLWDMINELIEESERREKNESRIPNNDHSSDSYNSQNKSNTTEKNIIITSTQSNVNNVHISDETDFKKNIGRGDIGPEDIQNLSEENNGSSDEPENLPKKATVNNKIKEENLNDKPIDFNVGVENQKFMSISTIKPNQHSVMDLNTQFLNEFVPQSKPKNEQQNLDQQYEVLEQTRSNDNSFLDFNQQDQITTNDNDELFLQSNINQLKVEEHVTHEQQAETQKLENFDTNSKMISNVEEPAGVTTEIPGFWQSVWGKTVNAKDKVVGWFRN